MFPGSVMSLSLHPGDAACILRNLNITPSAPNITELVTLFQDVCGDIDIAKRRIQRSTFVCAQEICKRDDAFIIPAPLTPTAIALPEL